MADPTCLFCAHRLDGRSKKFCEACIPPYGEWGDKSAYARRYNDLNRACGFQSPPPSSKLPHNHPARMVLADCQNRECSQRFLRPANRPQHRYCSKSCKYRQAYLVRQDRGRVPTRRAWATALTKRPCARCFKEFDAAMRWLSSFARTVPPTRAHCLSASTVGWCSALPRTPLEHGLMGSDVGTASRMAATRKPDVLPSD